MHDEIRTIEVKKFFGLFFKLFDNRLEISGSLHKYFNRGVHNANDFSYSDSIQVVRGLEQILHLNLAKCKIVNLEYGLNILPDRNVKEIVNNLVYHGKNEFRFIPDIQYAKQSGSFNARFKLNEYKIIKAYAKGFERFDGLCYGNYNSFRFEVKSKQSKYINKHGINTLADLTNPQVYLHLAEELKKEWSNVLMVEPKLRMVGGNVNKYTYVDFWENCLKDSNRNKFQRARHSYLKLLESNNANVFNHIQSLLCEKLNQFKIQLENGADSTTVSEYLGANSTDSFQQVDANSKTELKTEYADSTIVKMDFAPERCCPVTGISLFMQDSKSKFLTPVGLKRLYDNDKATYESLKLRFLPRSGISGRHTKHEWNEFKHIAKQIRNHYHNPKRYRTPGVRNQLSLFLIN
ncbi:hypothetical protein [Maribellus mangrovi]|uniref:hypothetical protein n=1 Tax=Maribellus mangrovi TaxID=3133146 RepID=UPI0030EEDD06